MGVEGCKAEGVLSTPDDKGEEGGGRPLVGGKGMKGRTNSGVYEVQKVEKLPGGDRGARQHRQLSGLRGNLWSTDPFRV